MPDIQVKVKLSERRDLSGIMMVIGQSGALAQFQVLGRGSKGQGDTQMQVKGNTPTGEYEISEIADTSEWSQYSYGPNGALRLKPISGNALTAEKKHGRKGLLIHGGALGRAKYWRGAGELRATFGCLRLSNHDMKRLRELIWEEGNNPRGLVCEPVRIRVTITDHPMSFRRP